MRLRARLREWTIRGLRRPWVAFARSAAGGVLVRVVLGVGGTEAALVLHDRTLSWLTARSLRGRRSGLALRLRHGARQLRYRPGILTRDAMAEAPPVALVVAWGVSAPALAEAVDRLADDAGECRRFTPIFLTDCDDFDALRRRDVLFEYIPDRSGWTRHHGTAGWAAYVAGRIRGVFEDWDPDRVVLIYDDGGAALRRDGLWDALFAED